MQALCNHEIVGRIVSPNFSKLLTSFIKHGRTMQRRALLREAPSRPLSSPQQQKEADIGQWVTKKDASYDVDRQQLLLAKVCSSVPSLCPFEETLDKRCLCTHSRQQTSQGSPEPLLAAFPHNGSLSTQCTGGMHLSQCPSCTTMHLLSVCLELYWTMANFTQFHDTPTAATVLKPSCRSGTLCRAAQASACSPT